MSTITREWLQQAINDYESVRDEIPFGLDDYQGNILDALRIALASLEREQIRHEHAKWSDSTFGCVGPIGPLKHLSKEALEAAAEPDDLSEWADMQFLLWDAQRRAGISDAEITAAMEDKLKINMERQWPEPKDGEPRLHIKEPGNSPVTPDGWVPVSERMPDKLIPVMVMYEDGEMWSAMWNGNRWDDGTEYPDPHSVTHWREMPAAPQQEVN
ncbi:TPA: dATP/dGTP pyrophosphohydrolase domain-containing protein [Escherichia coli]